MDVVKRFLDGDGSLIPPSTLSQLRAGFTWACEFGRTDVVKYLLSTSSKSLLDQPGLHWAAYGGHIDTVKLLLETGFSAQAQDCQHEGTPLEWALYGWGAENRQGRHYEVVALLVRSGATLGPGWYEEDADRRRADAKIQADPRMTEALKGIPASHE